jgi:cyclase
MLHEKPDEVKIAVKQFGAQAIIASIDYRIINGKEVFYKNYGRTKLEFHSFQAIIDYIEGLGCGEVFINSIDRDGSGEGFDRNSIQKVVNLSNLPVIACGGAIDVMDFEELSELEDLSGIAAGNMFHFTENIYPRSKKQLKQKKLNFR